MGDDTHRVPLRDRSGTVVAWAVVSAADYDDVAQHRWYLGRRGYAMRQFRCNGDRCGSPHPPSTHAEFIHRRVLGLSRGSALQADHINRDKLDNRRENLRAVTALQNNQNVPGGNGKSGVRGVHWIKSHNRWAARIIVGGRIIWGGFFDSIDDAAAKASAMRREMMPYSQDDQR